MEVSSAIYSFKAPRPTDGVHEVAVGSDIPVMRPRRGKRSSDRALATLLASALDNLAAANCTFWACEGPSRPRDMCTCQKCWAMREIATVKASLEARGEQP